VGKRGQERLGRDDEDDDNMSGRIGGGDKVWWKRERYERYEREKQKEREKEREKEKERERECRCKCKVRVCVL
jgi:hypothetical protein